MNIDEIESRYSELQEEIHLLKNEIRDLKAVNKVLINKIKDKEGEITKLNNQLTKDKEKDLESATSKRFNMVTILYSSIRGFSNIAENSMANNLIDELDQFYYNFDLIYFQVEQ